MINLAHIVEGWGKSIGIAKVSEECRELALERIEVCKGCPELEGYSSIKLIKKKVENIKGVKCKICTCPINEKVLVTDEECPRKKW